MKVWIGQEEFPATLDWTFREELVVHRLTGLRPGDVFAELLDGSTVPAAALAIVAWMREKPGESPDFLVDAKAERPDGWKLDDADGVLRIKLDLSDEVAADPPAEGPLEGPDAVKSAEKS